jgi:hypothetical protein
LDNSLAGCFDVSSFADLQGCTRGHESYAPSNLISAPWGEGMAAASVSLSRAAKFESVSF